MKLGEVEKLLNQKISFSGEKEIRSMADIDSAQVYYKGIYMQIVFQNIYAADKRDIAVYSIYSSDPKLKTRSGIRIGDDKLKIINAYEDYSLTLTPEYVDGKKSKARSLIYLDGESTHIVFHLVNNKVVEISLEQGSGGD